MPVAIDMGMHWGRIHKYDLWSFHWVVLWEIDLKLVGLISIKCTRSSNHFNNPPLKIIADFVVETSRRINLPFNKLFLKPIGGNLTEILKLARGV